MVQPNEILNKTLSLLDNNTIITGGHFRIFFNRDGFTEKINSGTLKSFEYAAELFLESKRKYANTELGILINDMGSPCGEEGCYLKSVKFARNNYNLPQQYKKVLLSKGLADYKIKIYWEKHIRNRGKKEFLKKLKRTVNKIISENSKEIKTFHIVKEPHGFYIYDADLYGKIILTRTAGKDKYGVPACPLIMAGLNIEQSKLYNSSINFYYIGSDNIENIPNYFVIEKGRRVSELFGSKIKVNNIYFE